MINFFISIVFDNFNFIISCHYINFVVNWNIDSVLELFNLIHLWVVINKPEKNYLVLYFIWHFLIIPFISWGLKRFLNWSMFWVSSLHIWLINTLSTHDHGNRFLVRAKLWKSSVRQHICYTCYALDENLSLSILRYDGPITLESYFMWMRILSQINENIDIK